LSLGSPKSRPARGLNDGNEAGLAASFASEAMLEAALFYSVRLRPVNIALMRFSPCSMLAMSTPSI
jgi:hypothetical protein